MFLTSFKIKNFRALKQTDWIPLSDLTIFTGENDSGKTASTDALQCFLGKKQVTKEDFYRNNGDIETEIVVTAKFKVEKDNLKHLSEFHPKGESNIIVERKFSSIIDTEGKSSIRRGEWNYITKVHPDKDLRDFEDLNVSGLDELLLKKSISIKNNAIKPQKIQAIKNWLNKQQLVDGLQKLPNILVDKLPQLEVFRALDPEDAIKEHLRIIYIDLIEEKYVDKLHKIENEISKELLSRANNVTKLLKERLSDIHTINISPTVDLKTGGLKDAEIFIKRTENSAKVGLESTGEGQKRRISLSVYEATADYIKERSQKEHEKELIIVFDEPDLHLDYNKQRDLLKTLKKFISYSGVRLIIISHSLNLIDRLNIEQIIHFSLKPENQTTDVKCAEGLCYEKDEEFLKHLAENMGLKNSIVLNERVFLVVGGNTENKALPILYEKLFGHSLLTTGIILFCGKGDNASLAVAKNLQNNGKLVKILVDNDAKKNQKSHFTERAISKAGFNTRKDVYFIGKEEFEDAFDDDIWAKTANLFWKKNNGTEWKGSDFGNLRNNGKFSEKILGCFKRECKNIPTKPIIGQTLAMSIDSSNAEKEIPSEIIDCFRELEAECESQ